MFEFVECMKSWKINGNLCTLNVQKVWIRGKIWIRWMYDIMKIQWKIVYIRCTKSPNSWKNSNSLNVLNCENSMEIYVH